jgi:hypothetical protein
MDLTSTWLFDVVEAPLEVLVTCKDSVRQARVPFKKAIAIKDSGQVLGVVGKNYRLVTNREALDLCMKLCQQVFPESKESEWELSDACGPKSRSRVALDLMHRTHVMNLWMNPGGISEVYTPFLRVINSYNGLRALRFDLGFMRKHCSNGVVFEEKVATVKAAHTRQGIAGIDLKKSLQNFEELRERFAGCLKSVRKVGLTETQSNLIVERVLQLPKSDPEVEGPNEVLQLREYVVHMDRRHRDELGGNAYATFNTMSDFATRPLSSKAMRSDRSSLQRRVGTWLNDFHAVASQPDFSLTTYLAGFENSN